MIAVGSVVFAAACTCETHLPFAAPAVAKQALPLVPQKQGLASPEAVQAWEAKHIAAATHKARSLAAVKPQQPSVPLVPREQLPDVQVGQAAVP